MAKANVSASRAIDSFAFIFFLAILAISIPSLINIDPFAVWFSLLVPSIWYLIVMAIQPIQQSRPLDGIRIGGLLDGEDVRLRVSDTMPTRALDLIVRRYIIINSQDLGGYYQDWRALLGHEFAHLRNGDSRYFHFAGIAGLITLMTLVLHSALFLSYFWLSQVEQSTFDPSVRMATLWFPVGFAAIAAFFLLWLRRSLHEREFLADQAGRTMNTTAFDDWLRRALRREKRASVRVKELPSRILKWFTHPSFARRSTRMGAWTHGSISRLVSDALRSVGFLYGGGALAYFVFMMAGVVLKSEYGSAGMMYLYIAIMILTVAAGGGAISIANLEAIDRGGLRRGLSFAAAVCAINWTAIISLYWLAVAMGWSDGISAGLAQVPPDQMSNGYLAFFVILGNISIITLAFNVLAHKYFGRFRHSFFVHLFVGAVSIVGAFLLTKIQWWIFT